MINVSEIKNCYGCGVCASSCPKDIITIRLNKDGFYEPQISEADKCLKCGICLDVCSFNHEDRALKEIDIQSWAAWSNDEIIRKNCSSGGIGFEIGKQLIEQGFRAVGCRYNVEKQRAEHFVATTVKEFEQSIGSKYIQSYTEEAFKQIKRKGDKYLITGTPCQIDSLRRMIQKYRCEDNFILMDFFCHCVPSMWAWKSYMQMLKPKIGNITYASWRNKFEYGWHDNWLMYVVGDKSFVKSRKSQGDLFYKLFLGDICLGPQCVKQCKYKYNKSSADIRIGDLWGNTYMNNEEGVSALVSFTPKGANVINELKGVTLIEHPFEVVAEGQMKENAKSRELRSLFIAYLRKGLPLDGVMFKILLISQRIVRKLHSIIKK